MIRTNKGRKVTVTMSRAAYKEMLNLKEIGDHKALLAYINETWGILGTVVGISFDD